MIAAVEQQQSIRMDCILVDSRGSVLEVQRQRVALVSSGASACAVIPESVFMGLVHALRHQRPDKRRFQLADMMTFLFPSHSIMVLVLLLVQPLVQRCRRCRRSPATWSFQQRCRSFMELTGFGSFLEKKS